MVMTQIIARWKEDIEKLIQRGLLRQFIGNNGERPPRNDEEHNIEEILLIEGGSYFYGSSNRSRKAFARRVQTTRAEVDIFHFKPTK